MSKRKWLVFGGGVAALLLVFATACTGFRPPEECAVPGGAADQTAFARHFTGMALLADGQVPPRSEEAEAVVAQGVALEVVAIGLKDTPTNLCIQERKGGGKIVFNQTPTLPLGESRTRVGPYAPGDYVIRVIVEGVLVRNLTFEVR